MRPCGATRAGTQAPPLPISIIFFHAIPHKQNNHLCVIHPNEINRPTRNPPNESNRSHAQSPKRNRRGGACVPARTSAQRRFHANQYTHCVRGMERWMRPCGATRAGTQAPPLPISIIFFHTIPHKQNNHLRAIHPNETRKQSTHNTSEAEMHRALPPP